MCTCYIQKLYERLASRYRFSPLLSFVV